MQELGLDAANEAIEEEAIRMEEMQTRYASAHVCMRGAPLRTFLRTVQRNESARGLSVGGPMSLH